MRGEAADQRSDFTGLMTTMMMMNNQDSHPLPAAAPNMMQQPSESIRQQLMLMKQQQQKNHPSESSTSKQVDPLSGDAKQGTTDLAKLSHNGMESSSSSLLPFMNTAPHPQPNMGGAGWPQSNNLLAMNGLQESSNHNTMGSMIPSQFPMNNNHNNMNQSMSAGVSPMEQAMIQHLQMQQQQLSSNNHPEGSMMMFQQGNTMNVSNHNNNNEPIQSNELEALRVQQRILLNSTQGSDGPMKNHSTGAKGFSNSTDNANTNKDTDPSKPAKKRLPRKKRSHTFPQKLHQVITDHASDDVFTWLPDGKSFLIVNDELFCQRILSQLFKACKYSSFVRKLHRWGFVRLTSGQGTDSFQHPLFQRGKPELAAQIDSAPREPQATKAIVDSKKPSHASSKDDFQQQQQSQQSNNSDFAFAQQQFGGQQHPATIQQASQHMMTMMPAGAPGMGGPVPQSSNNMMMMTAPMPGMFLNQQQGTNTHFGFLTPSMGSQQQQQNDFASMSSMLDPRPFAEDPPATGMISNDPGDLPITDDVWDDSDEE